jgi:hypothetical protein
MYCFVLFTGRSLEVTICFGLFLGHHQVVSFIQGNYTICDIKSLIFNMVSFSCIKPFIYYDIISLKLNNVKDTKLCV